MALIDFSNATIKAIYDQTHTTMSYEYTYLGLKDFIAFQNNNGVQINKNLTVQVYKDYGKGFSISYNGQMKSDIPRGSDIFLNRGGQNLFKISDANYGPDDYFSFMVRVDIPVWETEGEGDNDNNQ